MAAELPAELEQWVNSLVAAGQFPCRAAVVEEALWVLKDQEALKQAKLARLKAEVQKGVDALDACRSAVLDRALIERIKAEGREERAQFRGDAGTR